MINLLTIETACHVNKIDFTCLQINKEKKMSMLNMKKMHKLLISSLFLSANDLILSSRRITTQHMTNP